MVNLHRQRHDTSIIGRPQEQSLRANQRSYPRFYWAILFHIQGQAVHAIQSATVPEGIDAPHHRRTRQAKGHSR